MKRVLSLFLVALCSVCSTIFAQGQGARPDIDELLKLMRVEKMSQNAIDQMKNMVGGIAQQSNAAPDATAKMKTKMFALIEEAMSWNNVKNDYAKIYAEIFTPDEVKGLIAFYKTPAGQAFLDKQPQLGQKLVELAQKRMTAIAPKVQELIQQTTNGPKSSP